MPLEESMQKMRGENDLSQLVESIQNDFYLPIFRSGVVSALYFMPGWESSNGAKWEHQVAEELCIKIIYL